MNAQAMVPAAKHRFYHATNGWQAHDQSTVKLHDGGYYFVLRDLGDGLGQVEVILRTFGVTCLGPEWSLRWLFVFTAVGSQTSIFEWIKVGTGEAGEAKLRSYQPGPHGKQDHVDSQSLPPGFTKYMQENHCRRGWATPNAFGRQT